MTASGLGTTGAVLKRCPNVFGKVQSVLRTADRCYFYRGKQLTGLLLVPPPSLSHSLLYSMLIYQTEVFPASTGTTAHTTRHK